MGRVCTAASETAAEAAEVTAAGFYVVPACSGRWRSPHRLVPAQGPLLCHDQVTWVMVARGSVNTCNLTSGGRPCYELVVLRGTSITSKHCPTTDVRQITMERTDHIVSFR